MKFVKANQEEAAQRIAEAINRFLEEGSVLLLLSGGSNSELGVQIRQQLKPGNLTVGLIDERYGPVGHPDSNWKKLIDAGFDTKEVSLLPVLVDEKPIEQTVGEYQAKLKQAFEINNKVVGLFGIGTDGHTAGILPHSPYVNSDGTVVSYKGPDFDRISLTLAAIAHFDVAFLAAYGESKREPLEKLTLQLTYDEQPAQALKSAQELIVYNDQIGED